MGFDMVTALGQATAEGYTLFGHNAASTDGTHSLELIPGRHYEAGERVPTRNCEVPQVRQTFTILGTSFGDWGFRHGVNSEGVSIGRAPLKTRLTCDAPGLLGDELVRLTLERAHSAQHALTVLSDFIRRFGQGVPGDGEDNAFLIADPKGAFAVEAAGPHFAWQQVRELRVQGPLGTVRQDWDGISPGFSELVIGQGWWPDDGSKIDFAGTVCPCWADQPHAVRRWGQTIRLLTEQAGHVDVLFLRRLLSQEMPDEQPRTPSLIVELRPTRNGPLLAWVAPGPCRLELFFPIILEGALPAGFGDGPEFQERCRLLVQRLGDRSRDADKARDAIDRLQSRFDQEADDFANEAANLFQQGRPEDLQRQCTLFMQHCLEQFEELVDGLLGRVRPTNRDPVPAEVMDFFEG